MSTQLRGPEAQVCKTRDDLAHAAANADINYALQATENHWAGPRRVSGR